MVSFSAEMLRLAVTCRQESFTGQIRPLAAFFLRQVGVRSWGDAVHGRVVVPLALRVVVHRVLLRSRRVLLLLV